MGFDSSKCCPARAVVPDVQLLRAFIIAIDDDETLPYFD